jgi:hypothetical protein
LLHTSFFEKIGDPSRWAKRMIADCRKGLRIVLPLSRAEREFLNTLLDDGDIVPQLLTQFHTLATRISTHPALAWKALNVRQFKQK